MLILVLLLRYVLWCCGGIFHYFFTFYQNGYGHAVLLHVVSYWSIGFCNNLTEKQFRNPSQQVWAIGKSGNFWILSKECARLLVPRKLLPLPRLFLKANRNAPANILNERSESIAKGTIYFALTLMILLLLSINSLHPLATKLSVWKRRSTLGCDLIIDLWLAIHSKVALIQHCKYLQPKCNESTFCK